MSDSERERHTQAEYNRTHNNDRRWDDGAGGIKRAFRFFWLHKLYRDFWLMVITLLVVVALLANKQRVDDIQNSRVEQTKNICSKTNDVIKGYDAGQNLLATIVVSSVLSPGDKSLPAGEKDPFKWTGVVDGPLSKSIQDKIPGYPTGTERLKTAQGQAQQIASRKIKQRNCKRDVANIKNDGA